jgi:hypothetical protein
LHRRRRRFLIGWDGIGLEADDDTFAAVDADPPVAAEDVVAEREPVPETRAGRPQVQLLLLDGGGR